MYAIILAGTGRPVNRENKFFLPIGSSTVGDYVISALNDAGRVEHIVIVGDKDRLEKLLSGRDKVFQKRITIVQETDNFAENVFAGINKVKELLLLLGKSTDELRGSPVVVVGGDMPLITAKSVDYFLEMCEKAGGDFIFPVIPTEYFADYPPYVKSKFIIPAKVSGMARLFYACSIALIKPWKSENNYLELCKKLYGIRGSRFRDLISFLKIARENTDKKRDFLIPINGFLVARIYRLIKRLPKPISDYRCLYAPRLLFSNLDMDGFQDKISKILGIKFVMLKIEVPGIGLSMDIDDSEGYCIMSKNFLKLKENIDKLGSIRFCP